MQVILVINRRLKIWTRNATVISDTLHLAYPVTVKTLINVLHRSPKQASDFSSVLFV